eukprot:COSAG01_NODE_12263_length_1770_cov_4.520646_2_plen_216_part_00
MLGSPPHIFKYIVDISGWWGHASPVSWSGGALVQTQEESQLHRLPKHHCQDWQGRIKLPILKKAITKFRKQERIVGPKGTVAIQELLLKHGDSAEGSKTLLRKRWAQVRKQDHPPVGKMKAVDIYKYMYFVADKLDFDWSTVLTSGEKTRVGRKCYDAPKPGETADVPAQIVPKTRKFKRTRWHDIVSDVFKDSQYASRTFLKTSLRRLGCPAAR